MFVCLKVSLRASRTRSWGPARISWIASRTIGALAVANHNRCGKKTVRSAHVQVHLFIRQVADFVAQYLVAAHEDEVSRTGVIVIHPLHFKGLVTLRYQPLITAIGEERYLGKLVIVLFQGWLVFPQDPMALDAATTGNK